MEVITWLVILHIFIDFIIFKIIFSIVFIENLFTCNLKSHGANAKDSGQREIKQYHRQVGRQCGVTAKIH